MHKNQRFIKIIGILLFSVGLVMAFTLSSVMVWGDLEASLFTSGLRADENLSTLRCPIVITTSETGTITAELSNPSTRTVDRYLIANISEGYASLVREVRTNLPIPPQGKQKVEWKIYPEDAAFEERVILFRVYINPRHPNPSLGGNCGVVRIDLNGLTGGQIVGSSAFLAFASIGSGIALLEFDNRRTKNRSRKTLNNGYALTGILIVAGILSYLGMWVLGIALLAVAVLTLGILLTRQLGS